MASNNNKEIISKASPHTIKKFELVEKYIETWVQKLLQNPYCTGVIFIDCMCNSGIYINNKGETVYGSPIRVAKILRDAAGQYPKKKIYMYLNDNSIDKIKKLKENLPKEKNNFRYSIKTQDANDLLKEIGKNLNKVKKYHYFLLYDPYDARIDWEALSPFFDKWGEVMINHMVRDPIRAIKQVKTEEKRQKYEGTYMSDFNKLLPYGSDKAAYEKRVEQIILGLISSTKRNYYVASFPFFNTNNSLQYDLIHCTSNEEGFKLYKKTAWKIFGDKSSIKNTHGKENQYILDMDGIARTETDEECYYIQDVVSYIQEQFNGKQSVPLADIWKLLEKHPIFPSEGYRKEIKNGLKFEYGATVSKNTIDFSDRRTIG